VRNADILVLDDVICGFSSVYCCHVFSSNYAWAIFCGVNCTSTFIIDTALPQVLKLWPTKQFHSAFEFTSDM